MLSSVDTKQVAAALKALEPAARKPVATQISKYAFLMLTDMKINAPYYTGKPRRRNSAFGVKAPKAQTIAEGRKTKLVPYQRYYSRARILMHSGRIKRALRVVKSMGKTQFFKARIGMTDSKKFGPAFHARFIEYGVTGRKAGEFRTFTERRRQRKDGTYYTAKNPTLKQRLVKRSFVSIKARPFINPAYEKYKDELINSTAASIQDALVRSVKV